MQGVQCARVGCPLVEVSCRKVARVGDGEGVRKTGRVSSVVVPGY